MRTKVVFQFIEVGRNEQEKVYAAFLEQEIDFEIYAGDVVHASVPAGSAALAKAHLAMIFDNAVPGWALASGRHIAMMA
jgi:hypothetical protein